MKLLLISLNQQDVKEFKKTPTDISALGVRYLSSYLKSKGHQVNILFLVKPYGQEESKKELEQINYLISRLDPDLIGFNLMSNHFFRAKKITKAIRNKIDRPIIWGGIHPTVEPADCLDYADMVCQGEGELALEELLASRCQPLEKGEYNFDIQGIWYKKNNQPIANGPALLVKDIDQLPYPDYQLTNHYIIHQRELRPLTIDIFRQYYPASRGDHRLISSRGCPHACAYCCNSLFRSMYQGHYFRGRSVKGLINEMTAIKNQFPFIKSFKIMDDSFTVNSLDWIEEFSQQYKKNINLPFFCLVSPLTINKEKIDRLLNCGLRTVQIGLQSGSDRTNKEIYSRYVTSDKFLSTIQLLGKYQSRLKIILDVIVDNPYEKEKDILATIKVLNQLKMPFTLSLYSLAFYPGTELYQRAIKDDMLSNSQEYLNKEFHLFKINYWNRLIYLIPYFNVRIIEMFVRHRNKLLAKVFLRLLFFLHSKRNKLPYWLLRLFSKLKKRFLNLLQFF